MYLDYVGSTCSVYANGDFLPLMVWGEDEVKKVIRKLRELGGVRSPVELTDKNKRIKTSINPSSDHNEPSRFAIKQSVHEDIFELKLQMGRVKDYVWNLSEKLGKIEPELALLSVRVEAIAHLIIAMSEDCAKMVKVQLLVSLGDKGNRCHCQTVQTPLKRLTGLPKLWMSRSMRRSRLRAASAKSSSPGAPLKKTRTSGKEGLFQSAIFAHRRSLFTYPVKHKATEDRQMNRKPRSPYGPLMMPITSDVNLLINYAMAETSTEAEGRVLVASTGEGREILKRKDISCLAPGKMVDNYVIDYVALALSKKCDEEWHFPTNFSEKALSPSGSKNTDLWVEETRMSEPHYALKQENDVDCGMIVSLNMIHYGSNWYKAGGSNEYRARLLLNCLTAPMTKCGMRRLRLPGPLLHQRHLTPVTCLMISN
ncbi:hypothetical protein ACLB2K_066021 [Fragaria x ananassa]